MTLAHRVADWEPGRFPVESCVPQVGGWVGESMKSAFATYTVPVLSLFFVQTSKSTAVQVHSLKNILYCSHKANKMFISFHHA